MSKIPDPYEQSPAQMAAIAAEARRLLATNRRPSASYVPDVEGTARQLLGQQVAMQIDSDYAPKTESARCHKRHQADITDLQRRIVELKKSFSC